MSLVYFRFALFFSIRPKLFRSPDYRPTLLLPLHLRLTTNGGMPTRNFGRAAMVYNSRVSPRRGRSPFRSPYKSPFYASVTVCSGHHFTITPWITIIFLEGKNEFENVYRLAFCTKSYAATCPRKLFKRYDRNEFFEPTIAVLTSNRTTPMLLLNL